jgi:murein DD-endopeptidase MepM/ murein hydrolase activator NlpD
MAKLNPIRNKSPINKRVGTKSSFTNNVKRLFHTKNIVVVSKHSVGHYSFSNKQQIFLAFVALVCVGGISFSVGRYMRINEKVQEQKRTIAITKQQNEKIQHDFVLLKRDLMKISSDGGEISDYTQFVMDQYSENLSGVSAGKNQNKLLERINFLESQLQAAELRHTEFINDVYLLTKGKVKSLHKALKMTGMGDKLSQTLDSRMQKNGNLLPSGQGGAFQPIDDEIGNISSQQALNEVVYLAELLDLVEDLPTARPVANARRTSGFGVRLDPFRRTLARHTGIDFSAPVGSFVRASAGGRVKAARYMGAYGKTVDVQHEAGFSTRYSHLSNIKVRAGEYVKVGDVVGVQGSTGRSTGHHLHFEVRYNGVPINPDRFLMVGNYVSKILK